MAAFEYLIRFKSDSGDILYGEAGKPRGINSERLFRHNTVGSGATSYCQNRKGRRSMYQATTGHTAWYGTEY